MKRWGLFLIVFIVLFLLTFAISLLFFPSWIFQSDWQTTLSKNILGAGLFIVADGVVSWALSLFFEDNEFKEKINFRVGNKYRKISARLDEFTIQEISKEKRSRKYIPNIFVETTKIKEKLRYFSEPLLFFGKIIEETEQQIRSAYIIDVLQQIHYPIEKYKSLKIKGKISNFQELKQNIDLFKAHINQEKGITNILIKEQGVGLRPENLSRIPSEYSHIYDYIYPNLQHFYSFEDTVDRAEENLNLLVDKVLILKGLAGHGKTNLLCDFTENFLLRKEHKCIYLPARELNYIGEQESIEQILSRIIFSEADHQFSDILRLIKFDKKIGCLFIIFDGINEHKDPNLISTALQQFIQRCSEHAVKIILTCRSEYFDERFGNLLHLDKTSIVDMDDREYVQEIPDVHQHALISGYFSEFNIQLHHDRVHPEIIETFNEDKLLLRIFSEAYENDQPADYLDDLYKLEIFNRYYEKKLEVVPGLDECLSEIISWMIEHNDYTNIRLSNLTPQSVDVVERVVYENVVIRKDLIITPGVAFGKAEVINFVYDEFRDFLLASKLISNWIDNNLLAREQIRQFTAPGSIISEGLQKYLCLWGIKNDQQDLLTFLSSFPWFNLLFTRAVFNSPDKYHTAFIVENLHNLFFADSNCALHSIFYLSHRADIEQHPNLNLDQLLAWLNEVNDQCYRDIISVALNMEEDYKTSYINFLCHLILTAFREGSVSARTVPKLIQLLSYFSGVRDLKYPRYRENGLGQYPAYDAILMIGRIIDEQIVHEQARLVYELCSVDAVRVNLQGILRQLGGR